MRISCLHETNAAIKAKSKEMVNNTEEKAKAESDLTEACSWSLSSSRITICELHQSCAFIMKNFEIRQTARGNSLKTKSANSKHDVQA